MSGHTFKSDIWGVGCTVIELLTGHPPYWDMDQMRAMFCVVQDPHPAIPEELPEDVKSFLLKCFIKDPAQRPSAEELLEEPWLKKNIHLTALAGAKMDYKSVVGTLEKVYGEKKTVKKAVPSSRPPRLSTDHAGGTSSESLSVVTVVDSPSVIPLQSSGTHSDSEKPEVAVTSRNRADAATSEAKPSADDHHVGHVDDKQHHAKKAPSHHETHIKTGRHSRGPKHPHPPENNAADHHKDAKPTSAEQHAEPPVQPHQPQSAAAPQQAPQPHAAQPQQQHPAPAPATDPQSLAATRPKSIREPLLPKNIEIPDEPLCCSIL